MVTQPPVNLLIGTDQNYLFNHVCELVQGSFFVHPKSPDFIVVYPEEKTTVGIAEIRQLQTVINQKPFQEEFRIIVFRQADSITPEAQNALLKTLEEPPKGNYFFLLAGNISLLLPTVVSRCFVTTFPSDPPLDNTETKNTIFSVCKIAISDRLSIVETNPAFKDKTNLLIWLTNSVTLIEKHLRTTPNQNSQPVKHLHRLLQNVNELHRHLSANCNLRLSLDVFLLDLPSLGC